MFKGKRTIFHEGEEPVPILITFFGGEDISMLEGYFHAGWYERVAECV
jgi:hypothetical protein